MSDFLDRLPFDWTEPAAQELCDLLSETYWKIDSVAALAQQAGIPRARINWGQPTHLVWHDLIESARNQDLLRQLLARIEAGADAAVAVRLRELTHGPPVVEAPEPPAGPGEWKEFDSPDAMERQIFREHSLLDVAFLRRGLELTPAVARLLVTRPTGRFHGTAFHIGNDLLLTNHHVLYDPEPGNTPATRVEAWFGYEKDVHGQHLAHTVVMGLPDTIVGGKEHDWAVVRADPGLPEGTPAVALDSGAPVTVGDRVYVIQHPNGGAKKVGVHHNLVRHVDDEVLQYWTDTEAGSSGSPVFDEGWRLVGLHHRWVRRREGDAREYRNQGIRIERVRADLRAAGVL
ncbi:trypsin-like peptidase domain-containing protein [Streptomyces sp. NPDC008122]|uniref:trypsin-like peptidase domain-containing protein n=1 Tax=Streptomyces sp. NPDC008122 TaxID=3364810 RepID=UPI0036E9EF5F